VHDQDTASTTSSMNRIDRHTVVIFDEATSLAETNSFTLSHSLTQGSRPLSKLRQSPKAFRDDLVLR
jgi:hypothetical protein